MPFPNKDNIEGWFAVREAPWHVAGVFATRAEAEARCLEMGDGYRARYGEGWIGSDDVIFSDPPTA